MIVRTIFTRILRHVEGKPVHDAKPVHVTKPLHVTKPQMPFITVG